ncbi:MAG: DNA starvation/stationary phase protection protein Dps, partial [Pseudomonadota bacterium]
FAHGLNDNTRNEVVELLNARMADAIDLTLAVKQAHWNLKGTGFVGVHELLDTVADNLRDGVDTMAERAVILGGIARGTAQVTAEKSSLEPYPTEIVDIQEHIDALVERFKDFGEKVRKAAEAAEEAGDGDTEDLFVEVSRTTDKDAWFIGANGRQRA